jgi:hypothetical protein
MPYVLTLADAREQVKAQAAASQIPTITDAEVEDILERTAYASVWRANTAYEYGARIVPTARDGFVYEVTTAGTSGATEPTFPAYRYGTLTDNTVTFKAVLPDPPGLWNITRAVYEAWLLKAGKASEQHNFSEDGQSFSASDVIAHCLKMADRYKPVQIA